MDISQLLLFKPETIPKRKQDEDDEGEAKAKSSAKAPKKQKIEENILEMIDAADVKKQNFPGEVSNSKYF